MYACVYNKIDEEVSRRRVFFFFLLLIHALRVDLELLVGDPENDVPGHQPSETWHEAFVKGRQTFLLHHTNSAFLDAFVFARGAVHVPSLHHVYRTRREGCAKAGCHSGGQMARNTVPEVARLQDEVFDDVVADDLCHVHYGVPRDVRNGSWINRRLIWDSGLLARFRSRGTISWIFRQEILNEDAMYLSKDPGSLPGQRCSCTPAGSNCISPLIVQCFQPVGEPWRRQSVEQRAPPWRQSWFRRQFVRKYSSIRSCYYLSRQKSTMETLTLIWRWFLILFEIRSVLFCLLTNWK